MKKRSSGRLPELLKRKAERHLEKSKKELSTEQHEHLKTIAKKHPALKKFRHAARKAAALKRAPRKAAKEVKYVILCWFLMEFAPFKKQSS